jgi:hypothetical protein
MTPILKGICDKTGRIMIQKLLFLPAHVKQQSRLFIHALAELPLSWAQHLTQITIILNTILKSHLQI